MFHCFWLDGTTCNKINVPYKYNKLFTIGDCFILLGNARILEKKGEVGAVGVQIMALTIIKLVHIAIFVALTVIKIAIFSLSLSRSHLHYTL